ncbi:MAG: membrane dipeptidase, partial [Actinomycetota bacterium]|nr:membrane dipeptidase [Actinomycetota bacterium]
MIPVFDGHNDAITREGEPDLSQRRPDGHLDLPRMREGGVRGGIFAIFTPSPGERSEPVVFVEDGVHAVPLAPPVSHEEAAAHASAAAARLLELERDGELVLARTIDDVDAAREGSQPVAVLHLEGAEAIDPELDSLGDWYAKGLRSLGPVWSRANAFAHGVQFAFPSSPDIGPGLTERGEALVAACGELGILVDLSHMNEAGFW